MFQTTQEVWILDPIDFDLEIKNKTLNPIRYLLVEIEANIVMQLYDLLESDWERFVDLVEKELNEHRYTLYMN